MAESRGTVNSRDIIKRKNLLKYSHELLGWPLNAYERAELKQLTNIDKNGVRKYGVKWSEGVMLDSEVLYR